MSPVGTVGAPPSNWDSMSDDEQVDYHVAARADRCSGSSFASSTTTGNVLPRDGVSSGQLQTRGPGRRSALLQAGSRTASTRTIGSTPATSPSSIPTTRIQPHRPRQGRDQVGRRVDQLDRARECRRRLSGRARSRGDRHSASEVGRTAAAADRPRSTDSDVCEAEIRDYLVGRGRQMVAPGRDRVRRGAARTPRPASSARRTCATNIATIASRMPRRWSGATRKTRARSPNWRRNLPIRFRRTSATPWPPNMLLS